MVWQIKLISRFEKQKVNLKIWKGRIVLDSVSEVSNIKSVEIEEAPHLGQDIEGVSPSESIEMIGQLDEN